MERIAFSLGFIDVYWYSITMLLGVLLGSFVTLREVKRLKMDFDYYMNLLFFMIVFGFIGARLYYVLFNLSYYLANPSEILAIWNGGLAIHGSIIAGALTIVLYSLKHKKKSTEVIKYFDVSALGILLGQIIGRWGNFFNREAHGGMTTLEHLKKLHLPNFIIDGMYINGFYYQPTFLYESIFNLIGFIILMFIRKYKKLKTGMLISLYIMWYSVVRFFIEGMRTDSLMLGNLKMAQVISIVLFIGALSFFIVMYKKGEDYQIRENKQKGKKKR